MIIKELEKWGPHKFAALVTDNASNMVKTRRLVLQRFPHLVEVRPVLTLMLHLSKSSHLLADCDFRVAVNCSIWTCRCMMHAFNSTTLSVMGHPFAKKLVSQAQALVTFFRASHQPLASLTKLAKSMGIKRTLITSNKTRFTSVHASLESVVKLQGALQELVKQAPKLIAAAVVATINSDMFFVRLKQICQLLAPFTLVMTAVQGARTTLADVMRYWLFLAKQVSGLSADSLPADFKSHCFVAYNFRHDEMVSPLCKLGLFLHPLYRDVVSAQKSNWIEVQRTAGNMWNDGYKKTPTETKQLLRDMQQYKIHEDPFEAMPYDGELATLTLYWKNIADANPEAELPKLALLILDIKPHAADPERTVSMMGWFNQPRRSQLLSSTTTGMTMVKLFHQKVPER